MELLKKFFISLVCFLSISVFGINVNAQVYDGVSENSGVDVLPGAGDGDVFQGQATTPTITSGDYVYVLDTLGIYIVEYHGNEDTVYVPSKIDGYNVVGIYTETFAFSPGVRKIVIPDSVISIYDDAFIGCWRLEEIEVSSDNQVYASEDGILYSKDYKYLVICPPGKKGVVNVNSSTIYICDYSFFTCTNVTDINIPESVEDLGEGCFYEMDSLKNINISSDNNCYVEENGVVYYKNRDKNYDKTILVKCVDTKSDSIQIPETVETIEKYALYECNELKGPLELPKNLKEIGEYAFFNCNLLDADLVFPSTLENIGQCAFYGCKSLKSIDINEGITYISNFCFAYCEGLDNITIPDSVVRIDDMAFYCCKNVKSLNLGNNLESIGNWAFDNLFSLKGNLIIPDSVNSIGDAAFFHCSSLDGYIVIGKNVKKIGESAFYEAKNARGVIFRGCLPSINRNTFLRPNITYYHLNDKLGFENALNGKDVKVYTEKPVVNFIVDDEVYKSFMLDSYGLSIEEFAVPQKDGYEFGGWYYESSYNTKYNFSDVIMNDCNVYLKYTSKNNIYFAKSETSLQKGQQEQIEYTYELEDGLSNSDIVWTSSDNSVATVDSNGNITAIEKGETTITATCKNAIATIKVNVWKDENKIDILNNTISMIVNDTYVLDYEYHLLNGATNSDIIWSSSDNKVVTVDNNGKITAIGDGVATITASYQDAIDSIEITVLKKDTLDIQSSELTLKIGKTLDIVYEYYFNDGATSEDIIWSSSNTNVVKVNNGKIVAKLEGDAVITAKHNDISSSVKVHVVKPDKIEFKENSIQLDTTQSGYLLLYDWYSYNTLENEIIWKSSNEEVATVENGVLNILSQGETMITAICGEAMDTVSVRVMIPNTISFDLDYEIIRYDKDKRIDSKISYYFNDGADENSIEFLSDNPSVVKIENNVPIQVGIGKANITASYKNVSDTISIEIVENDSISFGKIGYIIKPQEQIDLPCQYYIYGVDKAEIDFSSSNEDVATVDSKGHLVALTEGETTITTSYGNLKANLYIVVSSKDYVIGDVNQDKTINSIDAAMVIDMYKNNSIDILYRILADINEDGSIDALDAAIIIDMYKDNI